MRVAVAVLLAFLVTAPSAEALTARGSTEEAYVLGVKRGERLELVSRSGRVVRRGRADRFGAKIFIDLRPGKGYRVRGSRSKRSRRFTVLRAGQNPGRSFYRRKRLKRGLNYVKARDGVELAMTVRLPPGKTMADGPFPTLIEYSGYQTAAPKDLLSSVV